jgi:hypothetical protein
VASVEGLAAKLERDGGERAKLLEEWIYKLVGRRLFTTRSLGANLNAVVKLKNFENTLVNKNSQGN